MYENGMPPGGFVDIGCGNGLLYFVLLLLPIDLTDTIQSDSVFILASEGFAGYGLDLRSRK
jgi:tRNASer (uridine44-2'-O)-methyltransferase